MNRCDDTLGHDRCEKAQGHDGFHRWRDHLWGFRVPEPEVAAPDARGPAPGQGADPMTLCRTCRKPIEARTIDGALRWGHVVNPTFQHHYAKPQRPSEAEKRAAWGDR